MELSKIKAIMAKFRDNGPKISTLLLFLLLKTSRLRLLLPQMVLLQSLTTPPSDVLKYTLADGSWIAVRPSGTEPKIKFYIAVVGDSNEDAQAKIATIEAEINAFIK